mgnify:CR=1 FL=1
MGRNSSNNTSLEKLPVMDQKHMHKQQPEKTVRGRFLDPSPPRGCDLNIEVEKYLSVRYDHTGAPIKRSVCGDLNEFQMQIHAAEMRRNQQVKSVVKRKSNGLAGLKSGLSKSPSTSRNLLAEKNLSPSKQQSSFHNRHKSVAIN